MRIAVLGAGNVGGALAIRCADLGHQVRVLVRDVEIGHQAGLAAEVLAGLEEGDAVVVQPGGELADGMRVRVRAWPLASGASSFQADVGWARF